MTYLQALGLGIIQGLTEFLPISSSGHLTLGKILLGLKEPDVFFDVIVHLGTLFAVVLYYRKDLTDIIAAYFKKPDKDIGYFTPAYFNSNESRMLGLLVVCATIPTAIIGVSFKPYFEAAFSSIFFVAFMFLITTLMLFSTKLSFKSATKNPDLKKSILIGIAQGFAILPGISRSGTTIAIAMALKISAEKAARFSFLLSIPAILGAVVLKARDVNPASQNWGILIFALLVSAVVGYAALYILIKMIKKGQLYWFGFWCILMSALSFYLAQLNA